MSSQLGKFQDYNDLYDEDMPKIAKTWKSLTDQFATKEANKKNLEELQKRGQDELIKIGIVGRVNIIPALLGTGPVVLELLGRLPDAPEHEHGFDHEKKRSEVLKANERGEKFLGEKG